MYVLGMIDDIVVFCSVCFESAWLQSVRELLTVWPSEGMCCDGCSEGTEGGAKGTAISGGIAAFSIVTLASI